MSGAKKKATQKKLIKVVTIDCAEPVEDDIFDIASFDQFLRERIKVNGKAGLLGESVSVAREATSITVTAKIAFSKSYLKYLTKKYLKKQLLRDYIRVIAKTKTSYTLRYFNIHDEEQAAPAE